MKKKIHPKYGECVVRCACGNVIETRGTKDTINVDICSSCHPFFTGKQKLVDSAGRIDKFKKKYGDNLAPIKKKKKEVKKSKKEDKPEKEAQGEKKAE